MVPHMQYQQCDFEDNTFLPEPCAESSAGHASLRPQAQATSKPESKSTPPGIRLKLMGGSTFSLAALVGAIVYMRGGNESLRMDTEATLSLLGSDDIVPTFAQCGGKDMVERVCERGCFCSDASGDGYFKMCSPPDGYSSCNVEVVQAILAKLKEDLATVKSKLEVAARVVQRARQDASQAWDQNARAKDELQKANHTLESAWAASWADRDLEIQRELKEAKARRTAVRKEAEAKVARIQRRTYEKLKEVEEELKKISCEQVGIQKRARDDRNDAINAARAGLKVVEDKLVRTKAGASMDRQDTINAARKKVEQTKQAQDGSLEKTRQALTAKKEAERAYDDLEEEAEAVEEDMGRYTAASNGGSFGNDEDAYL